VSNKTHIIHKYSDNTVVNKVVGKDIYFCCINDLEGFLKPKEIEAIKNDYTKNFDIRGVIRDYADGDRKSACNKIKNHTNDRPLRYAVVGTVADLLANSKALRR